MRLMVRADNPTELIQLGTDQVIEGHDRPGYGGSVMAGEPVREYRVGAMPYMERIQDPADPERTNIVYWIYLMDPLEWEQQHVPGEIPVLSLGNTKGQQWQEVK